MYKLRVYTSSPIENNPLLSPYLHSYYSALDFLLLPKENQLTTSQIISFNEHRRKQANKFIHPGVCLINKTDDVFSRALCHKYSSFFSFLAQDVSRQNPSGKEITQTVKFENRDEVLTIHLNPYTQNTYYNQC